MAFPRWCFVPVVLCVAACTSNDAALLDSGLPTIDVATGDDAEDIPILPPGCVHVDGGVSCHTGTDAGNPMDGSSVPCNQVTFTYTDTSAMSVWVSGSFTQWATTVAMGAIPMTQGAGGVWTVTTTISTPGLNTYKFVVDQTQWIADPSDSMSMPDGFGGTNSVLNVCSVSN